MAGPASGLPAASSPCHGPRSVDFSIRLAARSAAGPCSAGPERHSSDTVHPLAQRGFPGWRYHVCAVAEPIVTDKARITATQALICLPKLSIGLSTCPCAAGIDPVSSRLRGMLRNLDAGEEKSRKPVETAACYCRRVEPGAGAPPPRRCTSASSSRRQAPRYAHEGGRKIGMEVRPVPGMAERLRSRLPVSTRRSRGCPASCVLASLTNAMLTIKMPATLGMLSAKSRSPCLPAALVNSFTLLTSLHGDRPLRTAVFNAA